MACTLRCLINGEGGGGLINFSTFFRPLPELIRKQVFFSSIIINLEIANQRHKTTFSFLKEVPAKQGISL